MTPREMVTRLSDAGTAEQVLITMGTHLALALEVDQSTRADVPEIVDTAEPAACNADFLFTAVSIYSRARR